jgi:hypothetical protein
MVPRRQIWRVFGNSKRHANLQQGNQFGDDANIFRFALQFLSFFVTAQLACQKVNDFCVSDLQRVNLEHESPSKKLLQHACYQCSVALTSDTFWAIRLARRFRAEERVCDLKQQFGRDVCSHRAGRPELARIATAFTKRHNLYIPYRVYMITIPLRTLPESLAAMLNATEGKILRWRPHTQKM